MHFLNTLIAEFFSTEGKREFLGVSIRFWILTLVVIASAKTYEILKYGEPFYPIFTGLLWCTATVIVFPAVDYFIIKSKNNHRFKFESEVFDFLNKIKTEPISWSFNKKKSNTFVLILNLILWIVWLIMLKKYDFFVIIGTGGYMLIWLVIFSALHYLSWHVFYKHAQRW
jgi:hypothetical protein